jgi:hypothetical protein
MTLSTDLPANQASWLDTTEKERFQAAKSNLPSNFSSQVNFPSMRSLKAPKQSKNSRVEEAGFLSHLWM